MASTSEGYFGRAWGLLTRDKGWWKPVLILALALFVPIVGPLGVLGYELEWARLTAWGVDSSPKQKDVRIGECISSGWRGFVAMLGWGVIWTIVSVLLAAVSLFGLLNLAVMVAGFFVNTLLTVFAIRTAIYQKIGAGYQANRVADMVKADFNGFARVTGIYALSQVIIGIVVGMLSLIALVPVFMQVAVIASHSSRIMTDSQVASIVMRVMPQAIPGLLLILVVCAIIGSIASLINTTAAALWMRNFDVPSWGGSSDPIPCLAHAEAASAPAPTVATPVPGSDAPVSDAGAPYAAGVAQGENANPVPGSTATEPYNSSSSYVQQASPSAAPAVAPVQQPASPAPAEGGRPEQAMPIDSETLPAADPRGSVPVASAEGRVQDVIVEEVSLTSPQKTENDVANTPEPPTAHDASEPSAEAPAGEGD